MDDYRNRDYWLARWEELATRDPQGKGRGYASRAIWDAMAPSYRKDEPARRESGAGSAPVLPLLERRGVDLDGARVLDVGCGNGLHAAAFARRGAEVTALDFSEGMLDRLTSETPAELMSRIETVRADWDAVDLAERGWEKAFDLVFVNMTPAVKSAASFLKIGRASRHWCWYRGWAGKRHAPLVDAMRAELGVPGAADGSWNILVAFNLLFCSGVFADVEFHDVSFNRKETVEQAAAFFEKFFAGQVEAEGDALNRMVTAALEKRARQGLVDREMGGKIGTMTWKV